MWGFPLRPIGKGLSERNISGETGSFIWTKWHCSQSVCRQRRIKGFQQIIGIFCLCVPLAICCESFRTILLQTSKAANHPDMTSREAEGTPAHVRPFCLHVRACLGLRGRCQCHFPYDQMIRICCRGKAFGWKCHFCEEWEMRTQLGHVWWKRHKDYCYSWLFFLTLLESGTSVCFYCVFKKQTLTANPHTSSDVTDSFKQNILIQNECKQQFCQSNNTKQTVQNSHEDFVNRILTSLIICCKLTWILWCKRFKKNIPQKSTEKHQNTEANISLRSRTHFFRTVQNAASTSFQNAKLCLLKPFWRSSDSRSSTPKTWYNPA